MSGVLYLMSLAVICACLGWTAWFLGPVTALFSEAGAIAFLVILVPGTMTLAVAAALRLGPGTATVPFKIIAGLSAAWSIFATWFLRELS